VAVLPLASGTTGKMNSPVTASRSGCQRYRGSTASGTTAAKMPAAVLPLPGGTTGKEKSEALLQAETAHSGTEPVLPAVLPQPEQPWRYYRQHRRYYRWSSSTLTMIGSMRVRLPE